MKGLFDWVKERETPIGKFFASVVAGIVWAGVIFASLMVLGICGTCLSCGSCNCFEGTGGTRTVAWILVVFPVIAGVVVGIIYGISSHIQESNWRRIEEDEALQAAKKRRREKKLEKRQQNASEFKNNANKIANQCASINDKGKEVVLTPAYRNIDLQRGVWKEINEISLNMQKIENTVAELNAKEEK